MARQLQAEGDEVSLVVMLDTGLRGAINRGQVRPRLRKIKRSSLQHARELSNAIRGHLGFDVTAAAP